MVLKLTDPEEKNLERVIANNGFFNLYHDYRVNCCGLVMNNPTIMMDANTHRYTS